MGMRKLSAVVATVCASAAIAASPALAAKRPSKPPPAQGDFTDHLDAYDTARWYKADGWKNGPPFDNGWLADHIGFAGGLMSIRLDDTAVLGEPYASGNYQSTGFYGYGCYEASFKPVAQPGVVSSFFTFAGPYDNGGNGKHNEIDFEFLGTDMWSVQVNFWTNDDAYASSNEYIVPLWFDASEALHRYAFKWMSTGIEWYVDGVLVYQAVDGQPKATPKATDSLQKIMMNVWPVDETASGWAGAFEYPGHELHGVYDWVRYTRGENCTIGTPPEPPEPPVPPPTGDPARMHVQEIALGLNAQATQVIARVLMVDGAGQPVPGATVDAAWSGVITGGDTRRSTDSAGSAIFYSSRTRTPGEVRFCVTGSSGGGKTYDEAANIEDCELITK